MLGRLRRDRGPGVFLISASLLAFEVILLRLFAVETFHHFAYMAIGVALLGFGASGTALVLARDRARGREGALFRLASVVLPVALLAAPVLGRLVEFDPTQLLWDLRPWLGLWVVYACLALPFFVGGSAITIALMEAGERVGGLYAWSMVGSGLGGVLAIGLLYLLAPEDALAATVVPTLPVALVVLLEEPGQASSSRIRRYGARVAALALGLLLVASLVRSPWTVAITPFKGLPQVEAFPDARRIGEAWDPTGWATAVRAPAFHHAPGLSLMFGESLPEQVGLFVDGETSGGATEWGGDPGRVTFLDWLSSSAPYAIGSPRSVLVLGAGDGLQVMNALAHGAERITAVELVGPLVELADAVVDPASRVYEHPRVRTVVGDARTFAARTSERFDLIVLAASGTFAAGASGIHGTGENYLETVEAYRQFLTLLEPGGVLSVTGWLRTPPRDNVKLILTVSEALRALGVDRPGEATAFLRSWATGTLLVRPDGWGREALERLRAFAEPRLFDVDWPMGLESAEAHNVLDRPVFREALQAAAEGPEAAARFADAYSFDVTPATDDRPYFGRFLRLGSLPALLGEERGAWLPVAEWGYLAVLATLVQSGVLSLLLLGVPVLVLTRAAGDERPKLLTTAVYFWAIGFGFMFVELATIQRLGLVLGHPVLAASVTLAALLVFSGVGSTISDRIPVRGTAWACTVVALVAALFALVADQAGALVSLSLPLRASAALLVVAVPGLLMGAPFPMGLRKLAPEPTALAWAWAANGVASVIAASLATLLAVEIGGRGLILTGAACYLVAGAVARGRRL